MNPHPCLILQHFQSYQYWIASHCPISPHPTANSNKDTLPSLVCIKACLKIASRSSLIISIQTSTEKTKPNNVHDFLPWITGILFNEEGGEISRNWGELPQTKTEGRPSSMYVWAFKAHTAFVIGLGIQEQWENAHLLRELPCLQRR